MKGDALTVYAFLKRHRNEAFCDGCVEAGTGVERRQVSTVAETLALFPLEFTRTEQQCSQGCNGFEKEVTTAI